MPVSAASKPARPPRRPRRRRQLVADEALAAEVALGRRRRGRQRDVVLDERRVLGRPGHLEHLEARRALQHAVADVRRLQHGVAGVHRERLALVLVDDAHPAAHAVDDLEPHVVVVHVVRHRPAVGDRDVRGDEPPALPLGQQVAVDHPGPPGVRRRRLGPPLAAARATAGRRQLGDRRRVGRHDHVEPQPRRPQRVDRRVEVVAPQRERLAHHRRGYRAGSVRPTSGRIGPDPVTGQNAARRVSGGGSGGSGGGRRRGRGGWRSRGRGRRGR